MGAQTVPGAALGIADTRDARDQEGDMLKLERRGRRGAQKRARREPTRTASEYVHATNPDTGQRVVFAPGEALPTWALAANDQKPDVVELEDDGGGVQEDAETAEDQPAAGEPVAPPATDDQPSTGGRRRRSSAAAADPDQA